MNRQDAKNMAQSRDCRCVLGKDRDNNYNECIDKVFDWHDNVINKLNLSSVREALINYEFSKHENYLSNIQNINYSTKIVDEYLSKPKKIVNIDNKSLAQEFKDFAKQLLKSESDTRQFLIDAGINDENGNLTDRYKY